MSERLTIPGVDAGRYEGYMRGRVALTGAERQRVIDATPPADNHETDDPLLMATTRVNKLYEALGLRASRQLTRPRTGVGTPPEQRLVNGL